MARRYDDEAELVQAALRGDGDAFTTLFRRWFDRCVDVARRIVHDDEIAAEVAQEAFLVAWRQLSTLRDQSAFGGWVLRTTRNKALNRLERERRSVAVDQDDDPVLAGLEAVDDVAGDADVLDQQRMVWAASAALGERDASVLDLHLRHGLDAGEIAAALDITPNNAHQVLFRMKGKLAGAIRAWVIYKGGDPACPDLARALSSAGATSFSAATVKVIDRHVARCEDCTRRQAAILAPEAMFAAVPALPVAELLRRQAAAGLRDSGVPLGPDAAVPVSDAGGQGSSGGVEDVEGSEGSDGSESTEGGEGPQSGEGSQGGEGSRGGEGAEPSGATGSPGSATLEIASVALASGAVPTSEVDGRSGSSRRVLVALAVGVVLLLVGGVVLATRGDGADDVVAVADTTAPGTEPRSGTSLATTTTVPLVAPTTTAPAPATTTATTSVPSTTRPTVVPPPVTPPPPPPPPAPPQVLSFTATETGSCAAGGFSYALSWSTSGATSVSIASSAPLPNASPVTGGPQGTATACALTPGASWTLTATGPGGTAAATA